MTDVFQTVQLQVSFGAFIVPSFSIVAKIVIPMRSFPAHRAQIAAQLRDHLKRGGIMLVKTWTIGISFLLDRMSTKTSPYRSHKQGILSWAGHDLDPFSYISHKMVRDVEHLD